jgi:hypothetical protein
MKIHMQPTVTPTWNSIWKLTGCATEQILVHLGDVHRFAISDIISSENPPSWLDKGEGSAKPIYLEETSTAGNWQL